MVYKEKVCFLIPLLLVSVSMLWMGGITSLSLFYLTVPGIICFIIFCYANKFYLSVETKAAYFVCFLLSIYIFSCAINNYNTIKDMGIMAYALGFYVPIDISLSTIKEKKHLSIMYKSFAWITVIYLVLDFVIRKQRADFSNIPEWMALNPILFFYLLKENGIYGDSNATGMIGLITFCLFFFFYEEVEKTVKNRLLTIIIFVALFFTFSRSAIFSAVAIFIVYKVYYRKKKLVKYSLWIIAIFLIFCIISFFLRDFSFLSKIEIFTKTLNYLKFQTNWNQLIFGKGNLQSISTLGLYAHNPISIYIIEYGFVGLFLYGMVFLAIILDVGKLSLFIIFPFTIASLSYSPIHITYVFTALALIKQAKRIYKIGWEK